MTFQCPVCNEKPPPTLVAHRCERGSCTYAALEIVRAKPLDAADAAVLERLAESLSGRNA